MLTTHGVFVTVGICTFNRAKLLDQTLESLRRVKVPDGVTWEVIVVNNNSTDETAAVSARHLSHLPLRIVDEPTVGLCAARNRVIHEAAGDLIIYIDDDVLVDTDWLAEYVRASRECPDAQYFGGMVRPHFAVAPPRWVIRNSGQLAEPYSLADNGHDTRALDSMKIVGANMGFRTSVLKEHMFSTAFGQIGAAAMRGDETELLGRLRAAGMNGVWVGRASLKHYVAAERLTVGYLWHWYGGLGAYVARRGTPATALIFGAPRWAVKQYAGLLVRYWLLCPFKGRRWLSALREAGLMRGYIEEVRRAAKSVG